MTTTIGKTNYFVSPHENFILLHESFKSKKPIQVIIQLPSSFNKDKYKGRVYLIHLSWSFFDAVLGYDPIKDNDILDPKTGSLEQTFCYDSTWKYKIEPYDPMNPTSTLTISPTFPYPLLQEFDETTNRLIYTLLIPPNHYSVIRLDIELSSVYPAKQCPDDFTVLTIPYVTTNP